MGCGVGEGHQRPLFTPEVFRIRLNGRDGVLVGDTQWRVDGGVEPLPERVVASVARARRWGLAKWEGTTPGFCREDR